MDAWGGVIKCLLTVADLSFVIIHVQVLQTNICFQVGI